MKIIAGLFTVIFGLIVSIAFGLFTDYLAMKLKELNKKEKNNVAERTDTIHETE